MQKTILITGATSGFGKACAERFDGPWSPSHAEAELKAWRPVVPRELAPIARATDAFPDEVAVIGESRGDGRDRDRNNKPAHPRASHTQSLQGSERC